jgi:hypothetical protein
MPAIDNYGWEWFLLNDMSVFFFLFLSHTFLTMAQFSWRFLLNKIRDITITIFDTPGFILRKRGISTFFTISLLVNLQLYRLAAISPNVNQSYTYGSFLTEFQISSFMNSMSLLIHLF